MTTLTQSELDETRRKTEYGLYSSSETVLALLDHIAQLTAERDETRHQLDGAREEITCAHLRLDGLGAPRDDRDTALFLPQRIAELEAQPSAQFVAGMMRAAEMLDVPRAELLLHAGEMTAQESRTVYAVLAWRATAILAEAALKGEGE